MAASLTRDSFWKNVGVVLSGAAAAQAIPFVGSLVIARLFLPSEFGIFSAWLSATMLIAILITGRYEMAIVLEPTSRHRQVAARATLRIATISAAAIAACCAVALAIPGLDASWRPLIMLLAPTALLFGGTQIWQSWAASESRFADLSTMRIAQALGITVLQVVGGFARPSATLLAIGYCLGSALGLAIGARSLPLGRVDACDMRGFVRRHLSFPMWSLPGAFVNAAAAQLPVFLVAMRFGADRAGCLALALRILGGPAVLLGSSVLDVFKVSAAASYRETGNCRAEYLRTFKALALGSAVIGVPLALASEPLFALAFGERWREAGVVATWLLPLFALRFVASPLSYTFFIAGRQRINLVWQIALLAMTVGTLIFLPEYRTTLQAYSAGYCLLYLVYLRLSYTLSCGSGG